MLATRLRIALCAAGLALIAAPAFAQQPAAGNADAARAKISMCAGCHGVAGYKMAYPEVYHVPKIGGQQQAYLLNALKAYKSGERNHPTMRSIAASLSEQDMADLAAYYSGGAK